MKRKRTIYYVTSELGELKFYKYHKLIEWLIPYWPKWLHKLKVYKDDGKNVYVGQFIKNNRWPVRF